MMLCVVLLSVFIIGCNNNPKISGRVTFSDDQSPLDHGTVIFLKSDYTARGEIKKDGTYSISSEVDGKGLPKGTYKIYLDGTEDYVNGAPVPLVAQKLTNADTSGMELTVEKSQVYDIKAERSGAAKNPPVAKQSPMRNIPAKGRH